MIVIQRKCCVCVVEILREPSNREPLCEALGLTPVRLLPIALGLEVGARLLRHSSSDVLHQPLSPRISRPLVRSSHKRLATMQPDPIPLPWVVLLCSVVLAAVYGFSPLIPTPVPSSSSCLVRRVPCLSLVLFSHRPSFSAGAIRMNSPEETVGGMWRRGAGLRQDGGMARRFELLEEDRLRGLNCGVISLGGASRTI